ncbi:MAG: PaaI family thioesterase [Gammaproteobacteria bacterium]
MIRHARAIAVDQAFARHLGVELVSAETDRAVLRLPYKAALGEDRVNGGAIASLVDLAATCAFWSHPDVGDDSRGATVGFSISFMRLTVAADLVATAHVRRRGGSLCVGDVAVTNPAGEEVAIATVTYKLNA